MSTMNTTQIKPLKPQTLPAGSIPAVVPATDIFVDNPWAINLNNIKSGNPVVNLGCVANMFVRQMDFKNTGDCEQGHFHNFDHLTLLASGKLQVEVNNETTEFIAPCMIYIKKDFPHKLTALEPNTVAYCIHALRDLDVSEDIIAPEMIPKGSYLKKLVRHLSAPLFR